MWPFNSLASDGGMKKLRNVSVGRNRARSRSLRLELMESRMPLSASAVLLAAELTEETLDYGDFAVEETLVVEETEGTLAGETLGTEAETVCYPVEPSTETALDDSDDAALAESIYTALGEGDDALLGEGDDALLADSGGATLLSGPAMPGAPMPGAPMPGAPMPGAPMPGAPIVADPIQVDEPRIVAFAAIEGLYNVWHFKGKVDYHNPQSLTIVFDGVLQGETAAVNADGTFSFSLELPSGTSGYVSAQAFTPERVGSNIYLALLI